MRRAGNGPVILYELNEVPWQVFDWYCALRPRSHIASQFRESACFTTRTPMDEELHPWSTWPTLHRAYTTRVTTSVSSIRHRLIVSTEFCAISLIEDRNYLTLV